MHVRLHALVALAALLVLLWGCDSSAPSGAVEQGSADHGANQEDGLSATDHATEEAALEALERRLLATPEKGDLDAMLERGYIRVLVPASKTFFFYEGARPRGLAYEFMEAFADHLRAGRTRKQMRLTMIYVPTPRDRLISGITEGLGDIAIAGLTATEARERVVDFVSHSGRTVSEVVVTGPEAPPLASVEDLSGRRVFVRRSSSYYESLQALNARLRASGRPPVKIVSAHEHLEIEDILELIAGGVESITIADDYLARFWSDVLGDLGVRGDLVLRKGGRLGPVIRKQSPKLAAELRKFENTHGFGTLFGNVLAKRYLQSNPWVRNPNASADRERFHRTLPLFRKYANKYDFDTLLLAAQGYQESRLDQSVRSPAGAVGVMQIKPSTAVAPPVSIENVDKKVENNIHAGVKYLRHLIDDYFQDPDIAPLDRHLFAIAAYNAGPARIQSLRRTAAREGHDPNVWFDNVEIASARVVGRENVDYVRNILKYWVAYRLVHEVTEQKD